MRHPVGAEPVRVAGRDVVPVLHSDEELWQLRQFSVDNQHAEQTVETRVGKVVVEPKGWETRCRVLF